MISSAATLYEPEFIQGDAGRIFVFVCRADSAVRNGRGVLIIPPFAEEMNKSRRMLVQQAKRLAVAGFDVILPDLYGTGDSEGDFRNADWNLWRNDLVNACLHLAPNNIDSIDILALRSGALFVPDLLQTGRIAVGQVVLWQPVITGEQLLNQFFRLRLAAEMALPGKQRITLEGIRRELNETGSVEVAGYTISRALVEGLEEKNLMALVDCAPGSIHWCEVISSSDRALSPASRTAIDGLELQGCEVDFHKVIGPPFWGAGVAVIEDVDALLDTTSRIFEQK